MFTGIVEEVGSIQAIQGNRLSIAAHTVLEDVTLGASIAVNGCCLTVVDFDQNGRRWDADISEETWSRTNLGDLAIGSQVNLERPVRLMDRLGGHLVQGHIDCTGVIIDPAPNCKVGAPPEVLRYLVEKGSVTVNGVSLTVVEVSSEWFAVALIPHTCEVTNLGQLSAGDRVNIEVDITAKYVERLLEPILTQGEP